MKEIIERFIRTGKTTAEIQSEIIEFPDDITTEYLEKLGFEEIDAIKLKWKLRQNDRIREAEIKAAKGRRNHKIRQWNLPKQSTRKNRGRGTDDVSLKQKSLVNH